MSRLGIVPAGGRADRFGGVFKELLPAGQTTLLRHAVGVLRAGAAGQIVVMTTPDKAAAHMRALEGIHAVSLVQSHEVLFKSILLACEIPASWYLFAMPDTLLPEETFYRKLEGDFMLGLFKTAEPERFGVWAGTGINDKDLSLKGTTQWAWGVAAWSRRVVDFWMSLGETARNHTVAFNLAMARFGCGTFELPFYYDMASWSDYQRLVADVLPIRS
jgi:hypothetical protein